MTTGPVDLSEFREKQRKEHADKVLKMFHDFPHLAETAIIVDTEEGLCMVPLGMDPLMVVGILEQAKFTLQQALVEECMGDDSG